MYQALYRKYRPSELDEVAGQKIVIQTLKNEIINNMIGHAYLFTGPRGTGKTSVAKIFGKIVNCENLNGIIPCNKCVNCTQTNQKQNVDIIEIDAASNNGVDEIRELRNKVNLVPTYGKYKIYIIDEVHMLTTSAFNALLKTLEEPPKHIIFILATTEPHKLPLTILSRCQRFDFKKISEQDIKNRLKEIIEKEKITIEENALESISHLADGGLRDAINMLEQVALYTNGLVKIEDVDTVLGVPSINDLKNIFICILNNNLNEVLKTIDLFSQQGKNITKITEEMINYLKNILILKNAPIYSKENMQFEYDNIEEIDDKILLDTIKELNSSLLEMKYVFDPKICLEICFIKIFNNIYNEEKKAINNKVICESQNNPLEKISSNIKEEIKTSPIIEEKKVISNNDFDKKMNEFKKIRINNTLSKFDKKVLKELKTKINDVKELILDKKLNQYVSIILDGDLKAASDDNLIFIYESKNISDFFNENIESIEKIIDKVLNYKYKVISTSKEEWEIIKEEFNNKKKEYNYIEEKITIKELLKYKKEKDNIKNIFGDIVEYEEEIK